MPSPKQGATLAQALVQAQAAAVAVEKSSTNSHQRYAYASAESIMQAATDCLAASGLAFVCKSWCIADARQSGDGHFADVVAVFELVHRSGERMECGPYQMPAISGRGRPGDKAISTALTYLQGYSLRALLNLPRVEPGSDVDQRDDGEFKPRQRQQQAPASDAEREAYLKRWRAAWQALNKAKPMADIAAALKRRGIETNSKGKGVSLKMMQEVAAELGASIEPKQPRHPAMDELRGNYRGD